MDLLRQCEIEEVMVNLHHLPGTVKAAVSEESLKVHFSLESEILGTAGCLYKVRDFLGESRFIVSNGKTYFEQDLREVLEFHEKSGALVTMVLVPYSPGDPYNPVSVDSDGSVLGFARSRPQILDDSEHLAIYTGIQILEPEILDWIPPGYSDSVNDIYPNLMSRGYPVMGFVSKSYWCECSTPHRYLSNSLALLASRKLDNLCSVELPSGCSGVIAGGSVQVPGDTRVEDSIIWGDIEFGPRSSFRGVIISDDVRELPPDTHLRNVVVTPCRDGFQAAAKIGGRYALWPIS